MIAKHLPDDLGPVGRLCSRIKKAVCRPLLKATEGTFGIDQGVDFGSGQSLVMRDHANIGKGTCLTGNGTVTIGKPVMIEQTLHRWSGKSFIFASLDPPLKRRDRGWHAHSTNSGNLNK